MSIRYNHSSDFDRIRLETRLELFKHVFEGIQPGSLLDAGCGVGGWLNAAARLGWSDYLGVDGVELPHDQLLFPAEHFRLQDLTRDFDLGRSFDVVLCLEVAEHLDEAFSDVLVNALCRHADVVIFSAACPGQPGRNHINCQWPAYWQEKFNRLGYACDDAVRWKIWDLPNVEFWYRQNIFIARRSPEMAGREPRMRPAVIPYMMQYLLEQGRERVFSSNGMSRKTGMSKPQATPVNSPGRPLKRVCIVTPELLGANKNGGIGTFCYELALLLCKTCDVSILYACNGLTPGEIETVKGLYATHGIKFICPDFAVPPYVQHGADWFIQRSLIVFEVLKTLPRFDIIHFQDYHASGFIPIQAKNAGAAFADTVLTVTMHSSSKWIREAQRQHMGNPRVDMKLDYCERYCCEHADAVLSPSHYMVDWARGKGWLLPDRVETIPNPMGSQAKFPRREINPNHLVFFGRLEARKGIELFCAAIIKVLESIDHGLEAISFVGRHAYLASGEGAQGFLDDFKTRMERAGIRVNILSELDSPQATQYLHDTAGLVFIPSLLDNFPYAILECVHHSFEVFASRCGGIPEILEDDHLFEPTVSSLCQAIIGRKNRQGAAGSRYNEDDARKRWVELHDGRLTVQPKPAAPAKRPAVSVCIAHFNHGKYLPALLESLANNSEAPDQVIIIDDGSSCEESRMAFDREKEKYPSWTFVKNVENKGPLECRHDAVALATGEHLIFMDSDNVAAPNMIECFKRGMETSGADVLTCHYRAFSDDAFPYEGSQPMYTYNPCGGPIEAGILENIFGDLNCIMKKSVFESVDGFVRDRSFALSDWEILARICMKGYELDVIPLELFFYRHLEESWLRREDPYHNRQLLVKTYCEHWNQLSPQTIVADVILANQPGIPLLHGKNVYALHAEMEYLRRAVISARAWQKRGWFKRAFNKWREPK